MVTGIDPGKLETARGVRKATAQEACEAGVYHVRCALRDCGKPVSHVAQFEMKKGYKAFGICADCATRVGRVLESEE